MLEFSPVLDWFPGSIIQGSVFAANAARLATGAGSAAGVARAAGAGSVVRAPLVLVASGQWHQRL